MYKIVMVLVCSLFQIAFAQEPVAEVTFTDEQILYMPPPATTLIISEDKTSAVFVGSITEDPVLVEALLGLPETVKYIQLESSGGRLDTALKVALFIQKRQMTTFTYNSCDSACTYMFMAGKERWFNDAANSVFHRIRYYDKKMTETDRKIARAYWQGRASQYYLGRGLQDAFVLHIEQNLNTAKKGMELAGTGYATKIADFGLEKFPEQFLNMSKGTVIYPAWYERQQQLLDAQAKEGSDGE